MKKPSSGQSPAEGGGFSAEEGLSLCSGFSWVVGRMWKVTLLSVGEAFSSACRLASSLALRGGSGGGEKSSIALDAATPSDSSGFRWLRRLRLRHKPELDTAAVWPFSMTGSPLLDDAALCVRPFQGRPSRTLKSTWMELRDSDLRRKLPVSGRVRNVTVSLVLSLS